MNIRGVAEPYADRIVFVGDAGVSRLYKDGIGAAYRTAKAAARAAVFQGVSADDFRRHYQPVWRAGPCCGTSSRSRAIPGSSRT